ncbi:MAG: phospholipid carrier-dependent glycosyltransferase, partial [Sedimentisphaerales bacterium]|nr:phospholipid carrier-dependent glycosyltransferase [Sedimentisphaerales bacterium]
MERISLWLLAGILITAAVFMLKASAGDSAIMDELAHIPAGYGYVHNFDYRLNPEHPPLLKAMAMIPALSLNPVFPTDNPAWQTLLNGQWDMGRAFLYESGNNPDAIIRVARYFPIFLTLLTALLIFGLSAGLFGKAWALMPTFLFAFSPTILAHGHYVTTDVAATFGILLGTIVFFKYLFTPSRKTLFLAGLAFGVAELCKFSVVLLVPYFAVLAILWPFVVAWGDELGTKEKIRLFFRLGFRKLCGLAAIMAIGYLIVVYPVYFLFTRNYPLEKQSAETAELLNSYAHGPTAPGASCALTRCPAEITIWASKNEITRPLAEYSLGVLMTIQRAAGGNSSYFLGDLSKTGSRLYFPLVF